MTIRALPKQPDPEIVSLLEEYLDKAKKGEVFEIVIAASVNDEQGIAFTRSTVFEDRWRMLGALEYAKMAVHNA